MTNPHRVALVPCFRIVAEIEGTPNSVDVIVEADVMEDAVSRVKTGMGLTVIRIQIAQYAGQLLKQP